MDTDGLDPVTAEAIQLLLAADLVAAENYEAGTHGHGRGGQRRFNDPAYVTLIIAMICLVILAFGQARLVRESQAASDQRHQLQALNLENHHITEQIASCVEPTGACAKRGAASQATAIKSIIDQQAINTCKAMFVDQPSRLPDCYRLLGVPVQDSIRSAR